MYASKHTLFWVFFENFMWDEQYQQSRILFPIEQNGKRIQKPEEWRYLPFYTNHEYIPTMTSDTLNAFEKNIENDSIQLSIASIQMRVASNYAFEKKEGKWFLTKITQSPLTALPDSAFIEFLIAFSQDTSFQLQHIAFPLSEYYLDSEDNYKGKTKQTKRSEWEFWSLIDEKCPLLIPSNIQPQNPYRNIFFRGVENGIWIKYTFHKQRNEWKLISMEDYST